MSGQKPLPNPPPTLNQVIMLLWGACAAPPYALIGLAAWDGIVGFWSIVSPNWKDAVKHGPQQRAWTHQLREILFDAEEVGPEWWFMFGEIAIFCFEFIDAFAFWFMVGYVIESTLLAWTSQLWKMSPCLPKPNHGYIYSKTVIGNWYGNGEDWQAAAAWYNLKTNTGVSELGAIITVPAHCSASISVMVQWENAVGLTKTPMDVRIVDLRTGGLVVQNNFNPEKHDGKYSNGVIKRDIFTGDTANIYQVEFRQSAGRDFWSSAVGGHLSVQWDEYPADS